MSERGTAGEIEITVEMIDAGARVLMDKMEEGPYWSRHVAAEVCVAMLTAAGRSSVLRQIGLPAQRARETSGKSRRSMRLCK
jgi:hypothetical protein